MIVGREPSSSIPRAAGGADVDLGEIASSLGAGDVGFSLGP